MVKHRIESVNAVVLAGRANDGRLKDCSTEAWEALIDIGGRPMLAWVLDGLLGSKYVKHVTLVAPRDQFARFQSDRVNVVDPVDTMVGNAVKGCHTSPDSEFILVSTSDLPLINPQVVDRFIEQCFERDGDFFYPVVRKEVTQQKFPDVVRTYATIREGTFTAGNMILIRRTAVDIVAKRAEQFVQCRKSPIKQAGLLGWSFIIKLIFHTLTIPELERTVSRQFDVKAVAIISPDPEIGVDVDKPSDLELARRYLGKSA